MAFWPGGAPGGREITKITGESEVDTPWRVFVRSAATWSLLVWIVYACIALTIAIVHAASVHVPARWNGVSWSGDWFGFFTALWQGINAALRFARWTFPLPIFVSAGGWLHHGRILLKYRYVPEQLNRNWPPTYKAVDATQVGMLTRDNADEPWLIPPKSAPQPQATIPIVWRDEDGNDIDNDDLPLPKQGKHVLITFLRSVMSSARRFSRRGAISCGFTRSEFETLEAWFIKRTYAIKGQGLTAKGKRFVSRLIQAYYRSPAPASVGQVGI